MRSLRWFWVVLALGAGLALELVHTDSVHPLTHASDLVSLPLPARVRFTAPILAPHFSGPALVFTVAEFDLTCYFRHPPRELIVFPGDVYSVHARLELTPTGKFCVVQEMHSHVDP